MKKLLFLALTGLLFCGLCSAQHITIDDSNEKITESGEQEYSDDGRLFKMAWELPDSITKKYPATEYNYWLPASVPFGGGLRLLHYRDQTEADTLLFSGYFFFRPIVMDFSENYLSFGAYLTFDKSWGEERNFFDTLNPRALYRSDGEGLTAGFSMLYSSPASGIQMTFELGHYWSRVITRSSELNYTIPTATNAGKYQAIQKESGLDMYYNFTLTANRSFLAALSLNVLSTYRTGYQELSAKVTHPQSGSTAIFQEAEDSDFVLGLVYIKALAIPIKQKIVNLPVSQYDFITFEPAGGIGHFSVDDGHVLTAGGRISIFDSVAFSYYHNWEQKNAAVDSDVFFLEFGIQLGRRLGPGR